jgi:fluoroquinolone transport system permease protein
LRFLRLLKGDLFFLARYGLFFVYAVFIAVYLIMLHYIPGDTGAFVMKLLVFSDPAAMGLFFMGAVVLLEKSQRVNCSLAVSPVTVNEYVASKAVAFLLTGLAVALIIAFGSGNELTFPGIIGIAGGSLLFSMGGLFVASKTRSLNQFIIFSLPVEVFISLPGFLYAFGKIKSPLWLINPGVAAMNLLNGMAHFWLSAASLCVWIGIVFFLTKRAVSRMFRELGGGSL